MQSKKIAIVLLIIAAVISFYGFGLDRFLSLEYFQQQADSLLNYQKDKPFSSALYFFALYVAVTALSLPAATRALPLVRAGSSSPS